MGGDGLTEYRNGPHKLATILHQAFCQPYSIIPLPNPNFEPPALLAPPTNSLLDARNLSPTSATHDFASIVPPKEMPPANPAPLHSETSKEAPISESRSETHQGEAPPTPSTPIAPTVTVQQEDGMRVLLVEDNEINLKLLVATMRKLKLDHVTATNGLEALNSYKDCDGKFDVIFMGMLPHFSYSYCLPLMLTLPRHLDAHHVWHRIHTPHSAFRKRKKPQACRTHRSYWRREPEYATGGFQFWR